MLKAKIYSSNYVQEDHNTLNEFIKLDSSSRILMDFVHSIEAQYLDMDNHDLLMMKPDLNPKLGASLKNKLNAFGEFCNQFIEDTNYTAIAVDAKDDELLWVTKFKLQTFEEFYFQSVTGYELLLALEIHKNKALRKQQKALKWGMQLLAPYGITFDRIQPVIVTMAPLKAIKTSAGYTVKFTGTAFLEVIKGHPKMPYPYAITINGQVQPINWPDPFRVAKSHLEDVKLNLYTYQGLDTTVSVKNLVRW